MALTGRPTGMGSTGGSLSGSVGRPPLRMANGFEYRDLLRGSRSEYVDELAQLRVRGLRPRGNHLRRQAPRCLVGPSAFRPALWRSHLGRRAATGDRGRTHGAGPLSCGPAPGGPSCRDRCGSDSHPVAGHCHSRPRQHLGHLAHPASGPGRRLDGHRFDHGTSVQPVVDGCLGGPRLSSQDDRGMVGDSSRGYHLSLGFLDGCAARGLYGWLPWSSWRLPSL